MTTEEMQRMVQGIFDNIFNSVTSAEPGGKAVMSAGTTVLSLMKPGMAINSKDYRNPWTPGNVNGSKPAAFDLAELVDVVPKLSAIYQDSGNRVSQIYKQILDGVSIPVQEPNPAILKQLADADAVLWRTIDAIDPETGETTPKRVETALYRDYMDSYALYDTARFGYFGAYQEAQKTTSGKNTWPLIATTLQMPVRRAYDRWRSGGADKVEQAIAISNTSSQNALQKAFDNAKKTFEGYGAVLDDNASGLTPPTQRSSVLPSNWHSTSSTGWTTFDSKSSSLATSNTSDYKSFGGSTAFSLGLFSIGGSAGHTTQSQHVSSETKDLRISFMYTLASIRRPWMVFNLLGTKGWNLGNLYSKGKLSRGTKKGQEASALPVLPTSFVTVKDVVITADWSKADLDLIKKSTSGGGGFAIGPFSIGGTYASSRSKETYRASIEGGRITVPGVQIIGVISQVLPLCPPA